MMDYLYIAGYVLAILAFAMVVHAALKKSEGGATDTIGDRHSHLLADDAHD